MHTRTMLPIFLLLVVGVGALLIGATGAVAETHAEPSTETAEADAVTVTTTYPADEETERIATSTVVSPTEDEEITDITLRFYDTDDAFVDFDSFAVSIEPSGAAEIEERLTMGDDGTVVKTYEISALSPGESVEVEFDAYPRRIQSSDQRIDSTLVAYEFRRAGVEIPSDPPGFITAEADISGSAHYEAEELRTQVADLESDLANTSRTFWTGVLLSVLGVIAVAGAVVYHNRIADSGGSAISPIQLQRLEDDMEDLYGRLSARSDDESVVEDAEDVLESIRNLK